MLTTFRDAPPSRQLLLIGVVGALVCAILAGGYFFLIRTSYAPLYRDLAPADAATIVAALDKDKLPYRLANGGSTILVPADSLDSTRLHVAGQDLPLQGTVGFELFNSSSIGLTEFAQRINLQRALQGELARTIMRIDGVEAARVHLSMGEQTAFRRDRRPPRASVAVRTRPGRTLDPTTVRGIQRLVAGSVPDLDLASVAVLNDHGAVVSGEPPAEAMATGSEEERNVARFFEARIRRAIEPRYPAEQVEISVWTAIGSASVPLLVPSSSGEDAAPKRDFRIRATVAIAAPMTGSMREEVTQRVQDAVGFDSSLGDVVTVTASGPLPTAESWGETATGPAADTERTVRSTPSAAADSAMPGSLQTPLLILALIVIAALLFRLRGREPARMGEQQRLAFVANLKTLLAKRTIDDAPRT